MAPSIDEQPAVPALAVSALPMGVDGLRSPRVSMHTPRACQHTPRRASTFEVSAALLRVNHLSPALRTPGKPRQ